MLSNIYICTRLSSENDLMNDPLSRRRAAPASISSIRSRTIRTNSSARLVKWCLHKIMTEKKEVFGTQMEVTKNTEIIAQKEFYKNVIF